MGRQRDRVCHLSEGDRERDTERERDRERNRDGL